jgi:hypothetical protein
MTRVGGGGGFGGLCRGGGCGGYVGGGDLEDVGEEACSFEVHAIVGEQGGEVAERLLDGGAVVEVGDGERLVFDDGRDDGVAVGEAHEVVVHGGLGSGGRLRSGCACTVGVDLAAEVAALWVGGVLHGGGYPLVLWS